MIYTVTFNPSIDYIVNVSDFKLGITNRTSYEQMRVGGKGINVSIVLKNLGVENTALGFKAGFTGDKIEDMVREYGIESDFIQIREGCSRINLKISNFDGTEINGMGPVIDEEALDTFFKKLQILEKGDILVLSGSIPKGVSDNIYQIIMEKLADKGITVVVDATNKLLTNVLKYHPFLIKPNQAEINEIFGLELKTKEEVVPYAKKLKKMGAVNVLVSMGEQGAVLVDETWNVYLSDSLNGQVKNSVGAGDSMVAGFLTGLIEKNNYHDAFRMGIAAGCASAFSAELACKEDTYKLYSEVSVKML